MFPADPTINSTIQNPFQLFEQLGTFWKDYLSDKELLQYHQWAKLQMHGDVYLRAVEVAAAASIQQITPFAARQWKLVRLLESELTQRGNLVEYGGGKLYGDGTVYGQLNQNSYVWGLPTDIKEVGLLVDKVVDPDHVYDVSNCRFNPTTSELAFTVNPFTVLEVLPVYDAAGTLLDRQVLLWARNVQVDLGTPYLRFGAVLKVEGESSPDYVEVLRACWSMLVQGPSRADLIRGLMGSAGLRATVGNETVEIIETDTEGLAIITDQNVYRFDSAATPLVSVGDVVDAGQALTDTVRVVEFGTGGVDDYSVLPALAFGPSLMDTSATLLFPNLDEDWAYVDGDARFTVFGDEDVIEQFWTDTHTRGVTGGRTLAEYLGVTSYVTVPVNPVEFVIDHLIGSNLLVIAVKPEHFLAFEPGFLTRIKTLLPAGTLLIVQMQIETESDINTVAGSTSEATVYDAILMSTDTNTIGVGWTDANPSCTVS